MISVLSGDLYSRSGVKPQPRQRTGTIKFQQSKAPMSQQNFGEVENNLRGGGVNLLLAGADRSGTMGGADMNLINSPKSYDEPYYAADIERDLNLESLSNGDFSRVDATSMQRSFTHLQNRPQPSTIGGNNENILRRTTSEKGFVHNAIVQDLANDFADQLADAEQFKAKGDAFYANKKFEQAFKVYEIARDLVKDFCHDNADAVRQPGSELRLRVDQLRLTVLVALVESAF